MVPILALYRPEWARDLQITGDLCQKGEVSLSLARMREGRQHLFQSSLHKKVDTTAFSRRLTKYLNSRYADSPAGGCQ